jgi:hypothetical protein
MRRCRPNTFNAKKGQKKRRNAQGTRRACCKTRFQALGFDGVLISPLPSFAFSPGQAKADTLTSASAKAIKPAVILPIRFSSLQPTLAETNLGRSRTNFKSNNDFC